MDEPRLVAALERGTLICLAVEAVEGDRVTAVVLRWPYLLDGCLVFHDRDPTRRIELPATQFGAMPTVGDLHAAELVADDGVAWPPVDVTDRARAFTA